MKKRTLSLLIVVALVALSLPVVSGVPDQDPTREELEKIIKNNGSSPILGNIMYRS
jgi:hypothetical protein